uniref:Secreted protein n=1 Tax=Rhizophora mucronata TaxID=61149 RepID=A0A2P2NSV6_RHIMU
MRSVLALIVLLLLIKAHIFRIESHTSIIFDHNKVCLIASKSKQYISLIFSALIILHFESKGNLFI